MTWKVGSSRGFTEVRIVVLIALPDDKIVMIPLGLSATVIPEFDYHPVLLRFSRDCATQTVTFSSAKMQSAIIHAAYCNHKAFEAVVLPDNQLSVTFFPERYFVGELKAVQPLYLTVETNSEREPVCRIDLLVMDDNG